MSTTYAYADTFFDYQQIGSLASARLTVPLLCRTLEPRSVLDVGCGAGAWCEVWRANGVSDVLGVDAAAAAPHRFLRHAGSFRSVDVSRPFRLGRTFALAQCLEVAEHLAPGSSETLVDNLAAHAAMVLFSAAPPGQGGENHINERPYGHWRQLFQERGYALFDFLRPRLAGRLEVEPWYRYNMFLFAREDVAQRLPAVVRSSRLADGAAVPDVSPAAFRLRKHLLAVLPPAVVTRLARAKHQWVLNARGVRSTA